MIMNESKILPSSPLFLSIPSHLAKPQRHKKLFRPFIVSAALLMPLASMAQVACDGRLFLSQDASTSLNSVSTDTNPMVFTSIGAAASLSYNALGFSPTDGLLYAMRTDSNGNHLLNVDQSTGAVTDLGTVTGLPATPVYNSGTVGSNGSYYIKPLGNTSVIYAIDTGAKTATAINLSLAFTASDIAWAGGASGGLYSVSDTGQLYAINVANGAVTAMGAPDASGGVLGAQFGATNGMFGSANNGSGFYQINLLTGVKTLIAGSPGSSTNDGANCPNAAIHFPADLSITKTNGQTTYVPGTNVVYTIAVRNNGPFTAIGAKVTDVLPSGVSTANWSCSASAGGSCTSSGTGGISDTINLPMGATATYALTMAVPSSFTGNLVNTATVEADGSSASAININPDPDPSNDTATDTDTPATAPPVATPKPVPTMTVWGLLALAPIIGLAGFLGFTRRRQTS